MNVVGLYRQLQDLPSLLGTFPLDQFLAIGRNASD
jgi:hypothetical protein